MGASTVAAELIFFISIILIATGAVVIFKTYSDDYNSAVTEQWKERAKEIKTDINIYNVFYNNTTKHVLVYVMNTGKTKMKPNDIDCFVDSKFIPRNITFRNISVLPSTDVIDKNIWNPKEMLLINISYELSNNQTHTIDVLTPYKVKDSYILSLE